jgi:hypothetical protein
MAGDPGFWDVAWNWPLPFVTFLAVLAVPMAGIIWFICQLRYKQQIARLKNRVELADERLGDAREKIVPPSTRRKGVDCTDRKAEKTEGTIATRVAVYRRSSSYVVRNGLKSGKQAQRGSRSCSCRCVKTQG